MTRLEHANITVPDIDAAISFLSVVAPDFVIRKQSLSDKGFRWAHFGNDDFYIALQEPDRSVQQEQPAYPHTTYRNIGINHLGLVVEDLSAVEQRLREKGYRQGMITPDESFRKRIYYFDLAGFEWELIEYFSDQADEKNLYE